MHEGRISFILKFVTKLICKQFTHTMFENSKGFSYIILNNYISSTISSILSIEGHSIFFPCQPTLLHLPPSGSMNFFHLE